MSKTWWLILIILILHSPTMSIATSQMQSPVAIGMLAYLWGPTEDMVGLRSRLKEMGYRQDEHIALGVRFAEGRDEQLEPIIRQLVNYGAAILYVSEWKVLYAAQRATTHIPIVFATWHPTADSNRAERLATLGKNVTGVMHNFPGISPASLDRFRLLVPTLKRVLIPYDATDRQLDKPLQALRITAAQLGIELVEQGIDSQVEAKQTIMTAHQRDIDGVLPASGAFNISGYALEATLKHRMPSLYPRDWMVAYGGLASYGPSWNALGQQAAELVDKIIQGAKPETLPLVVSQKMTFTLNLRTAKRLGLTVPSAVISQADQVIR